jgi:hypothetical protein
MVNDIAAMTCKTAAAFVLFRLNISTPTMDWSVGGQSQPSQWVIRMLLRNGSG